MAEIRTLWHKTDDLDWHQVKLHAIDAMHALDVDPAHWKQAKPEPEVEAEPEEEIQE